MLLPIAQTVNGHWQPIKTWSTIALTISQNGLALSAATTAILIAFIGYRLFLNHQEKASLLTLYNKLPTKNKLLIKAVQNAKKQGTPTIHGISDELNKLTNTPTDNEMLKDELWEAEKVGLIEKTLGNKFDEPAYSWRSLLPEQRGVLLLSRFFK